MRDSITLRCILRKYIPRFLFLFSILTWFPHPLCQPELNGPHDLKANFCETVPLSSLRSLLPLSDIGCFVPSQKGTPVKDLFHGTEHGLNGLLTDEYKRGGYRRLVTDLANLIEVPLIIQVS